MPAPPDDIAITEVQIAKISREPKTSAKEENTRIDNLLQKEPEDVEKASSELSQLIVN